MGSSWTAEPAGLVPAYVRVPLVVEQGAIRREEDSHAACGAAKHLALDARVVKNRHRIRTDSASGLRLVMASRGSARPKSRVSEAVEGRTRPAKAECSLGDVLEIERPTTATTASTPAGSTPAPAFASGFAFAALYVSVVVGRQKLACGSKVLHGLEDWHAAVARHCIQIGEGERASARARACERERERACASMRAFCVRVCVRGEIAPRDGSDGLLQPPPPRKEISPY